MKKYIFKLYVVGQTVRSRNAIYNLKKVCEEALSDSYDLTIVDVLEHPEKAEEDKVLATPTLIKLSPIPQRRIIGDLSDANAVLKALEIQLNSDDSISR